MRRLAAIMLVLLLAGCTRAPAPADDAAAAAQLSPLASPAAPLAPFTAPAVGDLDVALSIAERWVRPQDVVAANATARASQLEWYLASRNPLAVVPGAGPFGAASDASVTLEVRREGRHSFALDGSGARLNVSIVEGALPLRLDARLVDDGSGPRFAPEELVGGRGSVVALANGLAATASVRRIDAMQPLGTGATVAFRMVDEVDELGDYDLVVVARDGAGAVGVASARIVYDNRKPDAEHAFGPFRGSFDLPPLAGAAPARHEWASAHPLLALDVTVSSSSGAPAPSAIRVTLLGADGAPLASTEEDGFSVAELPPGAFAFVVEHLEGALVAYEIEARGIWRLEPPESFFNRD